jgi:hypothetical protein
MKNLQTILHFLADKEAPNWVVCSDSLNRFLAFLTPAIIFNVQHLSFIPVYLKTFCSDEFCT